MCPRLCLQCIRKSKQSAIHIFGLCCNSFCAPCLPQPWGITLAGMVDQNLRCCLPILLRSSGTHQRSVLFPLGNTEYSFVSQGNKLASRTCLLIMYSMSQLSRILLEQPQNSMLFQHPRVEVLFREYPLWRTEIWGGAYGNPEECTAKRHWLYSNDSMMLERLSAQAGHLSKEVLASFAGNKLTKRKRNADGSWTWSGNKDILKASQFLGSNMCLPFLKLKGGFSFCLALRSYHERFGCHIAHLKLEMGRDGWKALVRIDFPCGLFLSCVCV